MKRDRLHDYRTVTSATGRVQVTGCLAKFHTIRQRTGSDQAGGPDKMRIQHMLRCEIFDERNHLRLKFTPEQVTKSQRGSSRSIALLFL